MSEISKRKLELFNKYSKLHRGEIEYSRDNKRYEKIKQFVRNGLAESFIDDKFDNDKKEEIEKRDKIINNTNIKNTNMKKDFSLTRAISAIVNNRQFEDTEYRHIQAGIQNAKRNQRPYNGQIVLPMYENERSVIQNKTGQGLETKDTDVLNILEPLRNNLILSKLGANIITGLTGGSIVAPNYSGTQQGFEGEVSCRNESGGNFTQKTYAPLRICQILEISKQWLLTDNINVEQMLRKDMVKQLGERLEKCLLSNDQAVANISPQGIFNLIPPVSVASWEDTVALETALRQGNYNGQYKYALSSYVNGALTTLPRDQGSGIFAINQPGFLNGFPIEISNSVLNKGGIVGDWSYYDVYIWSEISILVDTLTLQNCGIVRLIADMYVNAQPRDNNAFVTFTMA